MASRKASEVFVACLEAEGVEYVFGIPGEETLDLNESLDKSSIEFVPVRHEQGAGYMADVYGRLTGRAGVCLATLGPGAMNLTTAVADAYLDHAPLVALTGQGELGRMYKESHQYVDIMRVMRPITKWNARLSSARTIPELVRKAFKVSQAQKPGATHLELPEDVMAEPLDAEPLRAGRRVRRPEPSEEEIERAAEIMAGASQPIVLAGNGVIRTGATAALREFSDATGIPVAETFMGKGLLDYEDPKALGAVGLQAGDYALAGFSEADVVICVGYDLVEHAPEHWNPERDKRIVYVDTTSVEVDEFFTTEVDLVGDPVHILARLSEHCGQVAHPGGSPRLRQVVLGRFEAAKDDDDFPMQPPRALYEVRRALGRRDILISDVGLHKLWIGRMFPTHESNTVLIANGLAGMGFAVPAAIAAKLVRPDRSVVAINGDGGFLMNSQELETAVRLRTPFVSVVWEDGSYGSIVWKQRKRFDATYGTDFGNPDFVKLAESYGMPAWRCESADDYAEKLHHAIGLDLPSLIVVPIDYSLDVAVSEELGAQTVMQ